MSNNLPADRQFSSVSPKYRHFTAFQQPPRKPAYPRTRARIWSTVCSSKTNEKMDQASFLAFASLSHKYRMKVRIRLDHSDNPLCVVSQDLSMTLNA